MHYRVGTSAPSERRLRKDCEISRSCEFLGWVVHTPDEDGFLERVADPGSWVFRAFSGSPERAMKFKLATMAARIADELAYPAVVAATFDMGDKIMVVEVGGNDASTFAPPQSSS